MFKTAKLSYMTMILYWDNINEQIAEANPKRAKQIEVMATNK